MTTTIARRATFLLGLIICTTVGRSQSISAPTVISSGGPISISFDITNGSGAQSRFNEDTSYIVYLSNSSGTNFQVIQNFSSEVFPAPADFASATITRTIQIPSGTPSGSGYKIAVGSSMPTSIGAIGSNASAPFSLFCQFTMPTNLDGFIKSASPAVTYYFLSITNTGNVSDSYTLGKVQSLTPLQSAFYNIAGLPITQTPVIAPGATYSFMIRFDTPNGTQPNNYNTTVVTATSSNCTNVSHTTSISTFIYGGMGNHNMPSSPDMELLISANTTNVTVGDYIDYVITIKNNSARNASNPVIRDYIPANTELISYSKLPGETRNVVFSYNAGTNTLSALVQSSFTNATAPMSITVRLKTNCQSVPTVTNSAEIFTVSGDHNEANDVGTVSTSAIYNLSNAAVGTWTGSYSTDWFDCRNWSGGVIPNSNINAVVATAGNNADINGLSPIAPSDKTARVHDITINNSASLQMSNGSKLLVAGNWSEDGDFIPGDGTVTFNGFTTNAIQQISSGDNKITFYNLAVINTNSGKGVSVTDGNGIFVNNALDIVSGNLRLVGKAQLVQTKSGVSANSNTGTGKLWIDQQGQSNKFSYNYWSSPVGAGNNYTVDSVLKDGTNSQNPQNITWTSAINGSPTSPITLSTYWINKYQNLPNGSSNWSFVGPNGALSAGQGFTLKGPGGSAPKQKYTFVGKPNDGSFSSNVSAGNINLTGNPYPSALDAYAFIEDNSASTTGTLYFWEQYTSNSSHITANYEGGYATLTKTGATPPVSPAGISTSGSSSHLPKRYIAVGQGFLVFGSQTGGSIVFNNTQRAFVKENEAEATTMFRTSEVAFENKKLRLSFGTDLSEAKRQLLLGFMGDVATDSFDNGYDAVQIDTQADDMYFPLNGQKLVIQAKGDFDALASIPLAVKVAQPGVVTIGLDSTENFEDDEAVYLFDSETGNYHNLKSADASIDLGEGTFDDRFSIRFSVPATARMIEQPAVVAVAAKTGSISIQNLAQLQITSVQLINTLGQLQASWPVNINDKMIQLENLNVSAGNYIMKIYSSDGTITKKININ